MHQVYKTIEKSSTALAIFSGFLIFIMSVLSTFEAVVRTVFNAPTKWTLPISIFLMIYAIFLSSAYCFFQDGHIRIDILLDKLGESQRLILYKTNYVLSALLLSLLCWKGFTLTYRSFQYKWLTQTALQVPIGYVNIAIPIGCVIMILALFTLFFKRNE